VHSATRSMDFSHRHLARQVGGFGIRFSPVFLLDAMVQIVEHRGLTPEDFLMEEEVASSMPRGSNCPVSGAAAVRAAQTSGLRQGLLLGRCLRPGSCCATLQVPWPRQGP
jgi:hypothetical protein